jgi:hypothetical protein
MAEFATVKSAPPSVVMHSEALEFHSLFCTVYAPLDTGVVCVVPHSCVVAACAWVAVRVSAAVAATEAATAVSGAAHRLPRIMGCPSVE